MTSGTVSAPENRQSPPLTAVLRLAGLSPAEADGAVLLDVSRSHAVSLAVLPDGRRFAVKRRMPGAPDGTRHLDAECFAYRLASWNLELASVLPPALLIDERRELLVTEACGPELLLAHQALDPGFPSVPLAAALGRALAVVHTSTEGLPAIRRASCDVVLLPDTEEAKRHFDGLEPNAEAARRLSRTIVADDRLAEPLRRAAGVLRSRCLIHGDVKWDNAVIQSVPKPSVRLFDWELSGKGDPAWDLGSALADTVALWVKLGGSSDVDAHPATPALWALLSGYGAAVPRRNEDFPLRVMLSFVARLIHLALECAAAVADVTFPAIEHLLDVARRLAADSERALPTVTAGLAGSR